MKARQKLVALAVVAAIASKLLLPEEARYAMFCYLAMPIVGGGISNKLQLVDGYYYLPKSMRPVPKLSSAVAAVNADDDDGVVSATKARNKMLLCEACAEGKWDQVRGPMRVHCWWRR